MQSITLTVQSAVTGNGDIFLFIGVDERRIIHQFDPFKTREDQGKVAFRILAKENFRAFGKGEDLRYSLAEWLPLSIFHQAPLHAPPPAALHA